MKKLLVSLIALLSLAAHTAAQAPTGFNYQMVVRNSAGQLLANNTVTVRISIRHGTPTGPVVFQQSDAYQTNANGLVSIIVGNGSPQYASINWANGPYFLVSEVDPAGGTNYTLATRQQIMAVPYAEFAAVADHVSQSFTYDERDPNFRLWAFAYDSLVGAPNKLSQFTNDLAMSLNGDTLVMGSNRIVIPLTTTIAWDSITGHPVNLSQFNNDLTLSWSSITGQPTTIVWDSVTGHPTTIAWDSVTGHPVNLSQFNNDLTLSWSSITGQPTTIAWDSVTGHPVNLSQFNNDLTLSWDSVTGHPTTIAWDSVTGHPVNLSQFNNDLGFWGLPLYWDSITGHPTMLSQFTNDAGYLTIESQNLSDVLTINNNAADMQIKNIGLPSQAGDAANKMYVDAAVVAERARNNARIDSLNTVVTNLNNAMSDSISALHNQLDSLNTLLFNYRHARIDGELPGIFSVSAHKQIRFSSGNLQYRPKNSTWRFAERQYDICRSDNNNIANSAYTGWIDLFGFGTSGWNSTATYYNPTDFVNIDDYYTSLDGERSLIGMNANGDWGYYNRIINGGNHTGQWYALSSSEWTYILFLRPNATSLRGLASIEGVQGYILLPDNWQMPAGITFVSDASYFVANVYNSTQWQALEEAGAVFLPAAGSRLITSTTEDGTAGYYWTTSNVNSSQSHSVKIAESSGATTQNTPCSRGCSVRLVKTY